MQEKGNRSMIARTLAKLTRLYRCVIAVILISLLTTMLCGCATMHGSKFARIGPDDVKGITLPSRSVAFTVHPQSPKSDYCEVKIYVPQPAICPISASPKLRISIGSALEQLERTVVHAESDKPAVDYEKKDVLCIKVDIIKLEVGPPKDWGKIGRVCSSSLEYQVTLTGPNKLNEQSKRMKATAHHKLGFAEPYGWAIHASCSLACRKAALDILKWCDRILEKEL